MKKYLIIIFVLGVLTILAGLTVLGRQISTSKQAVSEPEQEVTAVTGRAPESISSSSASATQTDTTKENLFSSGIVLTVISPRNGSTVTTNKVNVMGKTVANAEVFLNDVETKADLKGNFSAVVSLESGENYILIVANDEDGNYAEQEITVTANLSE